MSSGVESLLPVAILVPSLDRPQRIRETAEHIHQNTPLPHRIRWMVSDPASLAILASMGEEFVLDDSGDLDRRYVTRMNKLIATLTDERTVFFGSDDVLHRPGWFEAAAAVMLEGPSVVVVNDLNNPSGTQALVRREYLPMAVFDDPAMAFHPGYLHNFADTEMFLTAHQRGEYARAPESIVEHLHPLFGKANAIGWDHTYHRAMQGWDHDQRLFEERAQKIVELLA